MNPWWPLVTGGLIVLGVGIPLTVYLHSNSEGDLLLLAMLIASLISSLLDILATMGLISKRWASEECRKIFFVRPFFWCYVVLLPYICVVALLFVAFKFIPSPLNQS